MLSDDLMSLFKQMEKQINDSPTYEFKASGTSAITMMHSVYDMVGRAIQMEQAVVPDRLKAPEPQPGSNVVRFDHWKAKQPEKRSI